MEHSHTTNAADGATIEHLMAGGEILASQLPVGTSWSPEKRLAAAVPTSALISLCNHQRDPQRLEDVEDDLAWVGSDDGRAPFSFLRLCEVFGFEPTWVREIVRRWAAESGERRRSTFSMHRHAA